MSESSRKPTTKVTAIGVAGALTIIIVWVLNLFGIEVPPEVASAFTAVIGFGVGYITPN